MSYTINQESFDSLYSYWVDSSHRLRWDSVFVLPHWSQVWWQELDPGAELYIRAVRNGEQVIGVAPLLVKDGAAAFIGSPDVCDYLDFVVQPGMEEAFFTVLLDDVVASSIDRLDLGPVRADSTVLNFLVGIARKRGYQVKCHQEDVTLELALPATWEDYLEQLTSKQRHEVRRKLRRLSEMGNIEYHVIQDVDAVDGMMDDFLRMFTGSRQDKSIFLTRRMESFFRSMADTMSRAGLLRLGILELNGRATAMVMYFDYQDCRYLYNSGYDARYGYLSVGLLSKVLCIKNGLEEGMPRFDFLKGDEPYKSQLGGKEVPLSRCQIMVK